jgi:flagellar motility protein MotE (MotC chaperone)
MSAPRLVWRTILVIGLVVALPQGGWPAQRRGEKKELERATTFTDLRGAPHAKSRIRFALEMMEEVKQKEEALARREAALHSEEERLKLLRQEILQTIEHLEAKRRDLEEARQRLRQTQKKLEDERKRLEALRKQIKQELDRQVEERLGKLAKVFDETTPEKAGKILSQLDPPTAAALLQRMNSRKAGRIWGYVDPERAREISRVLTQRGVSLGPSP